MIGVNFRLTGISSRINLGNNGQNPNNVNIFANHSLSQTNDVLSFGKNEPSGIGAKELIRLLRKLGGMEISEGGIHTLVTDTIEKGLMENRFKLKFREALVICF